MSGQRARAISSACGESLDPEGLADLVVHAARVLRRARLAVPELPGARVLSILDEVGTATINELAIGDGVAQPTMSEAVASLADRQLVERATDPDDARVRRVRITQRGRQALMTYRRQLGNALAQQAHGAGITAEEVRRHGSALRRLADAWEHPQSEPRP
ncbi:MarR family winged helix-turn-helix transcriptional regulator [Nocardioides humi]|uniref:HTH marR-type domain-containing protein n=1 Tax=Nocardioides humi TaxID=449461 RepID=A0ABN2AET4_9ACTN